MCVTAAGQESADASSRAALALAIHNADRRSPYVRDIEGVVCDPDATAAGSTVNVDNVCWQHVHEVVILYTLHFIIFTLYFITSTRPPLHTLRLSEDILYTSHYWQRCVTRWRVATTSITKITRHHRPPLAQPPVDFYTLHSRTPTVHVIL